uniref:Uncharacterized protein n=1 Tax=Tanacetum cinerariifolium TaxID=118510 RepID=A0A6L2KN53_TANCI|nr:hypothetical protein [Tanacetum cinerariifolium]
MDEVCSLCCGEDRKLFDNYPKPTHFKDFYNSLQQPQTHSSESFNDNPNFGYTPQEPCVYNRDPFEFFHKVLHKSTNVVVTGVEIRWTVYSVNSVLVSFVGMTLIMVTIVHLKFCLSTIRTCVTIKTLMILFHKMYLIFCENCGGPHESYQCQPMNQNCYDPNLCYNSNSFGFERYQPPQYSVTHQPPQETSAEILQASENLMKSIQTFLKKFNRITFREKPKVLSLAWRNFLKFSILLEKSNINQRIYKNCFRKLLKDLQIISEELAEYLNSLSWNCPSFYDDDDEYTIQYREYFENSSNAITPDLPTEAPDNSLSMGDEHLSTISKMESDEVIKSSVEDLVPIPSESEGIFNDTCDVPFCDNSPPLDVLNDHFEIFSDFNDDCTSSDDDSFEDIDYVEASPLDYKLVSLEEDSDSFFEKSDTSLPYSDNSLPEFETFSDHTKETSSGSTTTHVDNSLPEYDLFLFEIEPDQGELTSVVMEDILGEPHVHVPNMLNSDFIHSDDSLRSDLEAQDSVNKNKRFMGGTMLILIVLLMNKYVVRRLSSTFLVFCGKKDRVNPSAGLDRRTKRRKSSKDAEPSKGSKSKESKSFSSSKGTQSQHKSFGKSTQAEELEFEAADTEMHQDQGNESDHIDDQPDIEIKGRQVVPDDHFINNDLEYLKGGSSSSKYATFTIRTKAAKHDNIKGIEDMVPTLWSPVKVAYNIHARRIIVVIGIKVMRWYVYGYLEEIVVRRDDNVLYKFKECDFPRLNLHDIKDMLLLLVQKKLSNLDVDDRYDLGMALRMFTRLIVILHRVEDL